MIHKHLTAEEMEFLRSGATGNRSSDAPLSRIEHLAPLRHPLQAEGTLDDDPIRGLHGIHGEFANLAAEALQGPLRTPVTLEVECIEQRTFSEIAFGLQNPTCLQVLTATESPSAVPEAVSPIVLEMPLDILFPMMDRLLGGQEGDPIVPRALTDIERRLVNRLTGILLAQLSKAWSCVATMQWDVERLESNPQTVRCAAPGERCAVVVMGISFGSARGKIRGVYPCHALSPRLEEIAAHHTPSRGGRGCSRMP